jgi:hypothetical protein
MNSMLLALLQRPDVKKYGWMQAATLTSQPLSSEVLVTLSPKSCMME